MQRHLTKRERPEKRMCNCRNKEACPLQGKCLQESVVYEAEVETKVESKTYYGLTEGQFKSRYNQHQSDLRHEKNRHSTALSKYVHSLKDQNIEYKITWKINSYIQL